MKRKYAYEWADYLEQPGLKQARGNLSDGNRKSSPKCCLGHLEFMLGNRFKKEKIYGVTSYFLKTGEDLLLSKETMEKVGMRTPNGVFKTPVKLPGFGFKIETLSQMNDNSVSLKDIAKFIRKKYKEL